ncbi:hypothetical protein [Roseateles sp.]|uniref:hypothetical protein n=1 Tax=Roseateles sp. TaxID=1971397 RepID=UPI0025F88480|nr:hypothetical protein [Roseateles sp.]MBV8036757.1 hypothetical protein [Roseateles sp.]
MPALPAIPALQNQPARAAGRSGAGTALTPVATTSRVLAPAPSAAVAAQPLRIAAPGDAAREPGAQQRLGALQQGLAYAQKLDASLQQLKSGLSLTLARNLPASALDLQERVDGVAKLWQARGVEGAGQIDARLQAVPEGREPQREFGLRGLDRNSLAASGAETLRLTLPGQGRALSIHLDGQGVDSHLRAVAQGLAGLGVQTRAQADGGVLLSVAEARWPALRDGLQLRGDGRRFPSGQPVRAMLDVRPDALQPAGWQVDGADAQRASLARVVQAQQQLGLTRQALGRRLEAASAAAPAPDAAEAAAVARLAQDFAEAAQGAPLDYEQLSALLPAVAGVHRTRVDQLLAADAA